MLPPQGEAQKTPARFKKQSLKKKEKEKELLYDTIGMKLLTLTNSQGEKETMTEAQRRGERTSLQCSRISPYWDGKF